MGIAEYILIAFPAIFVILNPLMAASSFMSMTQNLEATAQQIIAKKACMTSFIVLVLFAAAGQFIFQMFNITVEAFRIAGGIILFSVGFQMLRLQPLRIKQTEEEREESLNRTDSDIAIVPLGIPIISGPGSITTVIVLMAEVQWQSKWVGTLQTAGLIFSCAFSLVIIYYLLMNSRKMMDLLKVTGIGVLTRIMGLILTVIATQFIINGVKGLLPQLATLWS